jgi:hypothetical protein
MLLVLTAALAIVVQDHAALRSAPRANATELSTLWQGDLVELRGERAGYLKVYNYRRERGGYLRRESVRSVGFTAAEAPELLAVLRFLRDTPGAEALGISYGAAYLKAVPAQQLSAEPFEAIGRMAERLADQASGGSARAAVAAHLEVVEQFGVHMHSFERNGQIQVCYDGELYRQLLRLRGAPAEARASAALGLTRPDCIDPALGPLARRALDDVRRELLESVDLRDVSAQTRSRVHARRAAVWATVAYEEARVGQSATASARRALDELLAVRADELGEDRRAEYIDAGVRVGVIRFAALDPAPLAGGFTLTTARGAPGQTCIMLAARTAPGAVLVRRCTYGIVWLASAQVTAQGRALVLAVQPLESWRELWVFHPGADGWTIDVLSPGSDEPEEGYVEFAGFAPATGRLLVAREVQEHGRFSRRFEELRLSDLALVKQASTPELLADFGRWQDIAWRRDTLALR